MGNTGQAAAVDGRLERRRQQGQPAPLQVQANASDKQIKALEKKLRGELDQYTKWQTWLEDKKVSIGKLREELGAESNRYQDLVEKLRLSLGGDNRRDAGGAKEPVNKVSLKTFLEKGGDIIDLCNESVEDVFGVDSAIYEVTPADRKEMEARTNQLREALTKCTESLFGETTKSFNELKNAHTAHVVRMGKKRKGNDADSKPARVAAGADEREDVLPPVGSGESDEELDEEMPVTGGGASSGGSKDAPSQKARTDALLAQADGITGDKTQPQAAPPAAAASVGAGGK